ncbi:MAG: hypothetical protein MZV70_22070 [Desulfobacterales bacterium]|nr:hypothetical protein [Desulfobacterales bacterium]
MKLNDVPGPLLPAQQGQLRQGPDGLPGPGVHRARPSPAGSSRRPSTTPSRPRRGSSAEYASDPGAGAISFSVDELGIDILGVGIPDLRRAAAGSRRCAAVGFYRGEGREDKLHRVKDILPGYQGQVERNMPWKSPAQVFCCASQRK